MPAPHRRRWGLPNNGAGRGCPRHGGLVMGSALRIPHGAMDRVAGGTAIPSSVLQILEPGRGPACQRPGFSGAPSICACLEGIFCFMARRESLIQ